KRNKRTGRNGDVVATAMAKRLIRLFGFQIHDAPGEAEAECALLQQKAIVDAVLSEDVDTIMFGCTRTLRSWSADGTRGSKTPTHVSMYDTEELGQAETGLDREGMVLVALMSGGDYIPEGVPGCGVKVACEAARAGFGKSICRLKKSDTRAIAEWRESLIHELRSNESGFFRTRHKALAIPDSFPNLDILRYYTHPVVSPAAVIEALRQASPVKRAVDTEGLREFVRETFDWTFRIGAVKFIRVMAPSMLVQKLLALHAEIETRPADLGLIQRIEEDVVKAISNRRSHFSTDATPELRLSYVPGSVVGLDLEKESEQVVAASGREGLALNSDDEFDEQVENELEEDAPRAAAKKVFNPLQPEAVWIPESIVKLGVPLTVEDWEEKQREKERARLEAKTPKRRTKKTGMPDGALDQFPNVITVERDF
ncbi:MAG: hypothetical protein OK454_07930, partial [Thaumarchaeota archaeon]|nr:hypothetical protein [Nitrososphaerota archaeon]